MVVTLCIGAFVSYQKRSRRTIVSIAVMPFVNETGNSDYEYLSDGMAETLIASLSQLPNLTVKARSSVYRYKGKEIDIQKVAQDLNVQAILIGHVVQRAEELTLSLELVDANTQDVIWSESYKRRQSDLVTLQSEIARDVSSKLKTKLTGSEEKKLTKTYTANPEAYQLYLRGRFHENRRAPRDLIKAAEYFQQAVAIDSEYAQAFAGMSESYTLLAAFGGSPPREAMPKARDAVLKAIALDPQLSEAYVALGHISEYYDYDLARAKNHFEHAIKLNPQNASAHEFLGTLYSNLGQHEDAARAFARALELEPLSLGINRMYGESLLSARKYDESIKQLKKTIDLDASFPSAHRSLSRAYLMTRDYNAHVEEQARYFELLGEGDAANFMRDTFTKGGWQAYLRAMTGPNRPTKYFFPFYVATYFGELGEIDKAFEEMNKTYQDRYYYIAWIKTDPCIDRLRADSRFGDLLQHLNFPK
jgi:TolB-like protein/lipoprotein NlpI